MISVVIPLSRSNNTVGECFKSIARQTYRNIEIIVKVNSNNQLSRNLGAKQALGTFLFFCDDDIILDPTCFEKLRNALIQSNASYAYCDYGRIGFFDDRPHIARPFDSEILKRDNYISTMSLIKRDHFPGFDERIKRSKIGIYGFIC